MGLEARPAQSCKSDGRQSDVQICKQHTPVLHHFFLERFREPPTWFECRLAFTRSVAVSSIAGQQVVPWGIAFSIHDKIHQIRLDE